MLCFGLFGLKDRQLCCDGRMYVDVVGCVWFQVCLLDDAVLVGYLLGDELGRFFGYGRQLRADDVGFDLFVHRVW